MTSLDISKYFGDEDINQRKNLWLEEFVNNTLNYLYSLPIVGRPFNSSTFSSVFQNRILEHIERYLDKNNDVLDYKLKPDWPFHIKYEILLTYGRATGQVNIGIA